MNSWRFRLCNLVNLRWGCSRRAVSADTRTLWMNITTRCIFRTCIFNSRADVHYAKKAGGESSRMILCFQRGEPQKQRSSAPLRVGRWPQGCRPTNPQVFGDSSNGLCGGFFREPDSCSWSWLNPAWQRPVPGLRLRLSEFCHKLQGRAQVTAWGGGGEDRHTHRP